MFFQVWRRVDHQHARARAGDGEHVLLAGGKEAGLARGELEGFAAHLDVRRALEEIADLLDARVRVRSRALAPLDLADQHLELPRADRLRADQAVILRSAVVRGQVWRDVGLAHAVAALHAADSNRWAPRASG